MKIDYKNNPSVLNDFLNYLNLLNYSNNTIKAYCSDLLIFFNFYKEYSEIGVEVKRFNIIILSKVKKSDVLAFLVYLSYHCNNNPYTRQRKLTSIRKFYKWLFKKYPSFSNEMNPTKDIPNIEKTIKLPKYLTLNQSKKIINIFTKDNCNYPLRNNTIVFLFLNTGLRVSELSNINISDINFEEKYISVNGKGNKERKVLINESSKKVLLKYIKSKQNKILNINEPLFLNKNNKRLGIDGVEKICKKAFNLIGINDKRYTAHTLRHTAATNIYQYSKENINIVKEFLGHQSIVSTQIYTHLVNNNIKQTIESNPLSNYVVKDKSVA